MFPIFHFLFFLLLPCLLEGQPPLPFAHAHNDYRQKKPLFEALNYGFSSIEIDVFSHKEKIKVSHLKWRLKAKPSLEELYLIPLQKLISQNGGTVFPGDSTPLILMIDLKKDKRKLYSLLKKQLYKYLHLLEISQGPKAKWGPLKIVLSGRPPIDSLLKDAPNFFAVDGYLHGLRTELDVQLRPRASTNFKKWANWNKKKGLSPADQESLKLCIKKAQDLGIKTRFWATPDDPRLWKILLELGVDWINVDDLEAYKRFIENFQMDKT